MIVNNNNNNNICDDTKVMLFQLRFLTLNKLLNKLHKRL